MAIKTNFITYAIALTKDKLICYTLKDSWE
jgi:hypothetical protein